MNTAPIAGPAARSAWLWLAFPAVTMSLGWALRGFIGGGPLGAMIPGAMVGLALCLLLGREDDAPLIAAFAAVGVGFGGQMTYGQTVGLSFQPETYWWAITGFAIKGGAWGLLGGIVIAIALTHRRYRTADLIAGFWIMVLGTWAGWKVINDPKLIYFSNRYDKPRPELWAGMIAGAALLLLWLACRGGARLPWRFALWGGAGGAVGFASGAAIQVWGRPVAPDLPLGWWKVMELTFGALLGLAYGWCAWRCRGELPPAPSGPGRRLQPVAVLGFAALAIAIALLLEPRLHTRFNYTIAGALLLSLALFSRTLCWQIAITLTYCAFAFDLLRNKPSFPAAPMWTFVVLTTCGVALATARSPRMQAMFLWISWTAVGMSLLKSFLPWTSSKPLMMESLFVLQAALITVWAARLRRRAME
jgi:hypothetical protein